MELLGVSWSETTYLSPAAGSSAVAMLDQKMGSADLALGNTRDGARTRTGAVVGGHVVLELLSVCTGRGLPSRELLGRVEVVGEVLGVGVSDLPTRRKTGVSLKRRC
jgi:hypothetical protein